MDTDAVAPVALGRRARATKEALTFASSKVIGTLTLERMAQCFPERDEPELMAQLQTMVRENYQHFIEEAWEVVIAPREAQEGTRSTDPQPAILGFVDSANALDDILREAEERRAAGEKAKDLWLKGADAEATVKHATNAILNTEIDALRRKRLALVEKNRATYAAIAAKQVQAERIEASIRTLVSDFQHSMVALNQIDFTEIDTLQARMIDVVPPSLS